MRIGLEEILQSGLERLQQTSDGVGVAATFFVTMLGQETGHSAIDD